LTPRPRFLLKGAAGDPIVVLQSRFWHFNAIGVIGRTRSCVIDPGIYPDEIEQLAQSVQVQGRVVTDVVLTHSHHDHIRGWMAFEGATVHFPKVAARKA